MAYEGFGEKNYKELNDYGDMLSKIVAQNQQYDVANMQAKVDQAKKQTEFAQKQRTHGLINDWFAGAREVVQSEGQGQTNADGNTSKTSAPKESRALLGLDFARNLADPDLGESGQNALKELTPLISKFMNPDKQEFTGDDAMYFGLAQNKIKNDPAYKGRATEDVMRELKETDKKKAEPTYTGDELMYSKAADDKIKNDPKYAGRNKEEVMRELKIADKKAVATGAGADNSELNNKLDAIDRDKHGEEYLKEVAKTNPDLARLIRNYGDLTLDPKGTVPTRQYRGVKGLVAQDVLPRVHDAYPDWQESDYPAKNKYETSFTSGPIYNNRQSLNTLLPHVDVLKKSSDNIDQIMTVIVGIFTKPYNRIADLIADNNGDPRVTSFKASAERVADEISRFYKGGNASATDIGQERERTAQ